MLKFEVKFAVYGALRDGNPDETQAIDVSDLLQNALGFSPSVVIGNETFPDPCFGYPKHFAAVVAVDGRDHYFACKDNQTINFDSWIPPSND